MKYKYLLLAIGLSPFVLALAYVIAIMSYLIVPILMAVFVVVVLIAVMQIMEEERHNRKP